ncbi:MAG: TIGR03619 family F420-dependent LLM class oxidoreductase [Chloroflexota bacterium]
MTIRFGVGLPSCREGTAYSVPFAQPSDFAMMARRAEALGFHSLWANDHLTTPRVISETQPEPPNFYEPLITYATIAGVTERIKLVLSVIVLPEREPVLLAKQVATLDALSGGRVMLGVGLGAYREEFEAVHPRMKGANRGAMLDEGIQALRVLFSERSATFTGRYLEFKDVELAPKPLQTPFPILLNAHADAGLDRVGRIADGWIVAGLRLDALPAARERVHAAASAAGRDGAAIDIHAQIWISLGADRHQAEARLRASQHFRRMVALHPERSEAAVLERFAGGNLIGSPEDVYRQLEPYERAGIGHVGLVFLAPSAEEMMADAELFATAVMPRFSGS